jgi:predicted Fe-Mo cluster-binding NifX family protein
MPRRAELMKVAVSTSGGGLEGEIFPHFGRCPTFTLVDTAAGNFVTIIQNPGAGAGGGAGIAAARAVAASGAGALITGSCGPNAIAVLLGSGIKAYSCSGNVRKAVESLLAGELVPISGPTSPPHSGMGMQRRGSGRGRGGI